ncbi:hypothetical protein OHB26_06865 [Nocardia sp. NBC_01503]|uniref:hypothetical protein n=1 Tax=Nocardia sp. NBC_01503 TaxID=2975997 RepID=UPI002E7B1762|nr:hypothetical protein [Nocardia sp. NBC_01503]WTL33931.1 hypothetical protein OHB26_06865 [Nocardia sp. NBC_01503]
MPFSPVRAATLIAASVITTAGLAILSPVAQAAPGGGQPAGLDLAYECDTLNAVAVDGKPKHYKLTGSGNCEVHRQLPEKGTVTAEGLDIGPKKGEAFWTCKGAEVSIPDKIASSDCVVGVPR